MSHTATDLVSLEKVRECHPVHQAEVDVLPLPRHLLLPGRAGPIHPSQEHPLRAAVERGLVPADARQRERVDLQGERQLGRGGGGGGRGAGPAHTNRAGVDARGGAVPDEDVDPESLVGSGGDRGREGVAGLPVIRIDLRHSERKSGRGAQEGGGGMRRQILWLISTLGALRTR